MKTRAKAATPLVVASAVAVCVAAPALAGSVTGVARWEGTDPDGVIQMDADPTCLLLHDQEVYTEQVVHDDQGNLANVFVYVKGGLGAGRWPVPEEPHLLVQKGCIYSPHVSGLMVGQDLVIRNDDETLHNVHALPTANREFNQGQPIQGMEMTRTFDKPEVMVRFKCDVHPWMSAYMGVLEHPFFAVTGADGSYSIDGLPAGTYELEAWHEELGTRTSSVTVTDDGSAEAGFDFSGGGGS